MWVEYRGSLTTVYNDGKISTFDGIIGIDVGLLSIHSILIEMSFGAICRISFSVTLLSVSALLGRCQQLLVSRIET